MPTWWQPCQHDDNHAGMKTTLPTKRPCIKRFKFSAWWQPCLHVYHHAYMMTIMLAWWHPSRKRDTHKKLNWTNIQQWLGQTNLTTGRQLCWKLNHDHNYVNMITTMPAWWQLCWHDDYHADKETMYESYFSFSAQWQKPECWQPCWHDDKFYWMRTTMLGWWQPWH